MTPDLTTAGACVAADRDRERVDPATHREHVVRRLLARGLSPQTLTALLPDFRPIVQRLAAHD